ncbi:MAG TPA: hypothetical protein ENN56_00800 [Firmicutes bacterium]|nr:hypothetical protein [Bacillota bacterium]
MNPRFPLLAGSAQIDITPEPGAQLSGNVAVREPAESVLDPLYAKALVVKNDETALCVIQLDAIFIERQYTEHIRAEIERRCGIPRDAIMVHTTQTHAAPSIRGFLLDVDFELPEEFDWLRLSDPVFAERAINGAIEAAARAHAELRPARIGWNTAIVDGIAFNRRGIRRDGTCGMPWVYTSVERPLGPTDYRYVEGPTDPEVGVVWLQDEHMQSIGFLLHFTCHPVNVFYHRGRGRHSQISADWPGAWATMLTQRHGGVGLVLNGCCGNINPWPAFTPNFVPDHLRMGERLTAMSSEAVGRITFPNETPKLAFSTRDIPLVIREPDAEALRKAKQRIAEQPNPQMISDTRVDHEWFYAAMYVSLDMLRQRTGGTEPYEIQTLRLGDVAVVGLPGEPFVEGQLKLKIDSPTFPTLVAHATTQYAGYIPTREAFARGGHECNPSWWARREPGALETIVETATEMLNGLFAK